MLELLLGGLVQIIIIAAAANRPAAARILAAAWLRALLRAARRGGAANDTEAREVVHDTIVGAWIGVTTGRFIPRGADRAASLLAYMQGTAWRIAHRRERKRITMRRRYVSLEGDEEGAASLLARTRDPTGQIEARSALRVLGSKLTSAEVSILVGRAIGLTHTENGAEVGLAETTASLFHPRALADAEQALEPPEQADERAAAELAERIADTLLEVRDRQRGARLAQRRLDALRAEAERIERRRPARRR